MKTDPMNISDAAREAERLVFFGIKPTTQDTRGYIASEVSHDFRCADDPEEAANKLRWNNRCVTGLLLLITKQERELEATAALTLELETLRQQLAEAREDIKSAAHWFNREPSSPQDALDNLRKAEAVLLQSLNPPTDEK